MNVFSSRLREIRKLRGITQKALAEHLGISENAYQNYEYGKREPNYRILAELCRVLEVSSDYLIGVVDKSKGRD